jgi:hypothetical protein
VEPHGLSLTLPARVSVKLDDSNAKVKMHDDSDGLVEVEIEDGNHGGQRPKVHCLLASGAPDSNGDPQVRVLQPHQLRKFARSRRLEVRR